MLSLSILDYLTDIINECERKHENKKLAQSVGFFGFGEDIVMHIPVVFVFFNKTDVTQKVFRRICEEEPSIIYLVSDGPRKECIGEEQKVAMLRNEIEKMITWKCNVVKIYADHNMGCEGRIISALDEIFENEEKAIILEDDCLPLEGFFTYCESLLEYYQNEQQVKLISGCNFLSNRVYSIQKEYDFSSETGTCGWATWRRVWQEYRKLIRTGASNGKKEEHIYKYRYIYEFGKKFNQFESGEFVEWDYIFSYMLWVTNGLEIFPKYNLVENIGYKCEEATHTKDGAPYHVEEAYKNNRGMLKFPLVKEEKIVRNNKYDKLADLEYLKSYNPIFRERGHRLKFFDILLWDGKKIVIYGAGEDGRAVGSALKQLDVNNFVYCDSSRYGQSIDHVPILHPYILKSEKITNILIGSRKYELEIYDILRKMNIDEKYLYCIEKII